jgi:hypothetical protein
VSEAKLFGECNKLFGFIVTVCVFVKSDIGDVISSSVKDTGDQLGPWYDLMIHSKCMSYSKKLCFCKSVMMT